MAEVPEARNEFNEKQYLYMNDLFWIQPEDRWLYENLDSVDNVLNERILAGRWSNSLEDLTRRRGYEDYIIKDDLNMVIAWRVEYIKQRMADYSSHDGEVENENHGDILDPYYSLRQYCLQNLPGTCDAEIDSIYFANAYPDQDGY